MKALAHRKQIQAAFNPNPTFGWGKKMANLRYQNWSHWSPWFLYDGNVYTLHIWLVLWNHGIL